VNQAFGKIILLNGASSSGKSTLSSALQANLDEAFWHYSIDHLLGSDILPRKRIDSGEFPWANLRPAFFEGFHRSIPSLAASGNNLIVEHIVETKEWMERLKDLLAPFDVFFVGVHCPLPELERRERQRGDRRAGEARQDYETTHALCHYDFEIDTTRDTAESVAVLLAAWRKRRSPSAHTLCGPERWPDVQAQRSLFFSGGDCDQAETDRLWSALVGHGGQESACGWCKDKWGLSWQITPRALIAAITDPDPAAAKRAFEAMMEMTKIDIAVI